MQTDYYELLGVSREADTDEIKRAYRTLARQYHPDINKDPEAEGRFKKIAEAYETLSDPEKKREYDYRGQGFSGFTPVEDLFSHFTQQHAPARPRRGADIQQIVDLTFEESVFGTTKAIRYLSVSPVKGLDRGMGSLRSAYDVRAMDELLSTVNWDLLPYRKTLCVLNVVDKGLR